MRSTMRDYAVQVLPSVGKTMPFVRDPSPRSAGAPLAHETATARGDATPSGRLQQIRALDAGRQVYRVASATAFAA
jgi:hypothetical protein